REATALQETNAMTASVLRRGTGGHLAQPPQLRQEIDSASDQGDARQAIGSAASSVIVIPGYEILGGLAPGGIGVILKGRDAVLGRELAIKVVLDRVRDNAEVLRRFVEEAQITGQLQHPGIAPVHELGRTPDGRPYFAMKLIKGRTLAKLLKDRPDAAH